MPEHTPHIGAARDQAIANIYAQIANMQFSSADDALDAAVAVHKLSEATMDDISISYYEAAEPPQ